MWVRVPPWAQRASCCKALAFFVTQVAQRGLDFVFVAHHLGNNSVLPSCHLPHFDLGTQTRKSASQAFLSLNRSTRFCLLASTCWFPKAPCSWTLAKPWTPSPSCWAAPSKSCDSTKKATRSSFISWSQATAVPCPWEPIWATRLLRYLTDKVKVQRDLTLNTAHHPPANDLHTLRVVVSRLLRQRNPRDTSTCRGRLPSRHTNDCKACAFTSFFQQPPGSPPTPSRTGVETGPQD